MWCWVTRCSPPTPPASGRWRATSRVKANPDSNYDLPQDVIDKTIEKYLEAYEMLTGKKL